MKKIQMNDSHITTLVDIEDFINSTDKIPLNIQKRISGFLIKQMMNYPNGYALKTILMREYTKFGKGEYKNPLIYILDGSLLHKDTFYHIRYI